jgi:quercetin dioxygenase-like cupin family protein
MPYFHHPKERKTKELLPGVLARTFWGENLMLAVVDLAENAVIPEHSHPHDQGGIVLQGEPTFTINGETRRLKPGDLYIIPGGVTHSVQVGEQPAQVLDIFNPVRQEYKY